VADLSSKLSIYLRSSGASLLATVVSKVSGFASVWLLNRILVKGAYGNYEFAFTVVSLLLLLGSGGLNHAVMYRLSRLDAAPEELDGHDFAGAALGWSLIVSTLFAAGVFVGAPYIEALAGNEDLAFWVSLLAFLMPIGVAREVYKSWFKARQRIPEAILMGRMLPAIGKVGFLGGIWIAWPTPQGVVAATLLSEFVPLLIWYGRAPVNPLNLWGQLSSWDIWYSLKLATTGGLNKTMKRADVLMVGFLAVAEATAEYVVAFKLALVLLVAHNLLNNILQPRIGKFISNKRWTKIIEEYDQVRSISLTYSLAAGSIMSFFGKEILLIFGEYESAYPILMITVATYTSIVSVGMCGKYLNISGYAGWSLSVQSFAFVSNIILNYFLVVWYGALGAAIATFISYIAKNIINAYIIFRLDGLSVYSIELGAVVTASVLVACLAAAGVLSPALTGVLLLVCTAIVAVRKSHRILPVVKAVAGIVFGFNPTKV
jgi:O-antigen/teichoic acid export membrane protein